MKKIYIAGMGCGGRNDITLNAVETLKKCDRVFLRTAVHPSVSELDRCGIHYETFDSLYESADNFETLYAEIAQRVTECEGENTGYVVPGSAVFAEKTVQLICKNENCETHILPSVSFIDGILAMLKLDGADSFKLTDALRLDTQHCDPDCLNIICQIYDRDVAADTKLALMKYYDEETEVFLVSGASGEDAVCERLKLYEIDRSRSINHLTSLVIPAQNFRTAPAGLASLQKLVAALRGENGCPWDKAQTHASLTPYVVEEAYEVVEAIRLNDADNLKEELGDLLYQVMLHSELAAEEGRFDIYEVIRGVSEKLIRRHPHVFAGAARENDMNKMWEKLKEQEHTYASLTAEMQDVPKSFPALIYAEKIQKKAAKADFDFKDAAEAAHKTAEELGEFSDALEKNDTAAIAEEGGDLLFAAVNTMRLAGLNSEEALKNACEKFMRRFAAVEAAAIADGTSLKELGAEKADKYWEKVKKII